MLGFPSQIRLHHSRLCRTRTVRLERSDRPSLRRWCMSWWENFCPRVVHVCFHVLTYATCRFVFLPQARALSELNVEQRTSGLRVSCLKSTIRFHVVGVLPSEAFQANPTVHLRRQRSYVCAVNDRYCIISMVAVKFLLQSCVNRNRTMGRTMTDRWRCGSEEECSRSMEANALL